MNNLVIEKEKDLLQEEFSSLASSLDRRVTNSKYDSITHTRHCKWKRKSTGFYQCYLDDYFARIAFDKKRICRPPPSPCGLLDEHGNPCHLLGTHVHTQNN